VDIENVYQGDSEPCQFLVYEGVIEGTQLGLVS
jgi:hypothetical protein